MFNEDQIKGKWKEFKGGVRNIWGQISDEDLEKTKGNITKIMGLVQSKYGETEEVAKAKMEKLMSSFDNNTDKHPRDIGSTSYERNPTADDSETNFSVGQDSYDSSEIYEKDKDFRGLNREDRNARH